MSEYDRGVRFTDLSLDKLKAERRVLAIRRELEGAYKEKMKLLEDRIIELEGIINDE